MSRHSYKLQHEGESVEVLMGWDRPLQQVYLTVEALDSDDGTLYSTLDYPDPSALTVSDFRLALSDMKIKVPESMFIETERDRRLNAGNRLAIHQADSTFKVILEG